jgi:hypothetical protein
MTQGLPRTRKRPRIPRNSAVLKQRAMTTMVEMGGIEPPSTAVVMCLLLA